MKLIKSLRQTRYDKNESSMLRAAKLKVQLKNLIKKKKIEYAKGMWKELEKTIKEKNEAHFWGLITPRLRKFDQQLEAQISANTWYDPFLKIFGTANHLPQLAGTDGSLQDIKMPNLPLWARSQ